MNRSGQSDRRASERFPIARDLRYRIINKRGNEESGDGKTVNMSSSGLLFTAGEMLLPGRRVEVSVSWPAQLNQKCALKFVARGRVVRFDDGQVAIEIQQHEFRTQSTAARTAPAAPAKTR